MNRALLFQPGDLILDDRYRIETFIHSGHTSQVYHLTDRRTQSDLALQLVDPTTAGLDRATAAVYRARFQAAVSLSLRTQHPHLLRAIEFQEVAGRLYLLAELAAGGPLTERLKRGPFSLEETVRLTLQLAAGLAVLHQTGLVHHVLSPDNILFDAADRIKIAGLAWIGPPGTAVPPSTTQSPRQPYLSPEQRREPTEITPAANVYSLGALFWTMLSGRRPAVEPPLTEQFRQLGPYLPAELTAALIRMSQANPDRRFAEAAPARRALLDAAWAEARRREAAQAPPTDPSAERPSESGFELTVESEALQVEPGHRLRLPLAIRNWAAETDHFTITAHHLPPGWAALTPTTISVPAGQAETVMLALRPPRQPQSRAGDHPFEIRVAGRLDPGRPAILSLSLAVSAYTQFSSSLQPGTVQSGQPIRITVHNQGNAAQTFNVACRSQTGLTFKPAARQLQIAPGERAAARFQVKTRPRLVGGPAARPFTAHVEAPTGQTIHHNGQVLDDGLIPTWGVPALSAALVALIALAFLVFGGPDQRSPLPINQTEPVVAVLPTTSTPQPTDPTPTPVTPDLAATTTAVWLIQDDDDDGLTNDQEIRNGTDPTNPDSDDDGLSDGQEQSWGTNPFAPDTDNDGLSDGQEVNSRQTNPRNPDTDNDGLGDAVDPDPGRPPTPVPPTNPPPPPPSPVIPTDTPTVVVVTPFPSPTASATQPPEPVVLPSPTPTAAEVEIVLNLPSRSVTTAEDTPLSIDLLADELTTEPPELTIITPPQHGTLSGFPPTINYQPDPNFNGEDRFSYALRFGPTSSNEATVSITVTPVNDPPLAGGDAATTEAGQAVEIAVLDNDVDVDGDPLQITAISPGPANGNATVTGPGIITYQPDPGFSGSDPFTYTLSDGNDDQPAIGQVVVTVLAPPATATPVQPPAGPQTLGVTQIFSDGFDLAWESPAGDVAGFRLYDADTETQLAAFDASQRSGRINGLACGQPYRLILVAFDQNGESLPSPPLSIETGPCP